MVDINISVDLLAHDGSIFKNVSSRELKRVRGLQLVIMLSLALGWVELMMFLIMSQ